MFFVGHTSDHDQQWQCPCKCGHVLFNATRDGVVRLSKRLQLLVVNEMNKVPKGTKSFDELSLGTESQIFRPVFAIEQYPHEVNVIGVAVSAAPSPVQLKD